MTNVLYVHYENRIMKPIYNYFLRVQKSNRRGEFDQITSCTCVEISQ
jgi:hypothetical protein